MNRDEEIEHLSKRRNELRMIHCNLQDIQDWFRQNDPRIESIIPYGGLSNAMETIDVAISGVERAIDTLEVIENE